MVKKIDILRTLFNVAVLVCSIIAVSYGGILGIIAGIYVIAYGYVLLGDQKK